MNIWKLVFQDKYLNFIQSNQLQECPWLQGKKITAYLGRKNSNMRSEWTLFLSWTGLSFICEGWTSVVCQSVLEIRKRNGEPRGIFPKFSLLLKQQMYCFFIESLIITNISFRYCTRAFPQPADTNSRVHVPGRHGGIHRHQLSTTHEAREESGCCPALKLFFWITDLGVNNALFSFINNCCLLALLNS